MEIGLIGRPGVRALFPAVQEEQQPEPESVKTSNGEEQRSVRGREKARKLDLAMQGHAQV